MHWCEKGRAKAKSFLGMSHPKNVPYISDVMSKEHRTHLGCHIQRTSNTSRMSHPKNIPHISDITSQERPTCLGHHISRMSQREMCVVLILDVMSAHPTNVLHVLVVTSASNKHPTHLDVTSAHPTNVPHGEYTGEGEGRHTTHHRDMGCPLEINL